MRISLTIGGLVVALLATPQARGNGHYYSKQVGFMFFKNRLPPGQGGPNSGPNNFGPRVGHGCYGNSGPNNAGPGSGCYGNSGPNNAGPGSGCTGNSGPNSGPESAGPGSAIALNALAEFLCRRGGMGGSGTPATLSPEVTAKLTAIEETLKQTATKTDIKDVKDQIANLDKSLSKQLISIDKALEEVKAGQAAIKKDVEKLKEIVPDNLEERLKDIESRLPSRPPVNQGPSPPVRQGDVERETPRGEPKRTPRKE